MAKIFFITSRFPYPLEKGDKLRVYFQLKHLAIHNKIHLIAINNKPIDKEQFSAIIPFCKSIEVFVLPTYKRLIQLVLILFTGIPLQVAYFYNDKIRKQIENKIAQIKPDAIHCHLIRTTEYIKNVTKIPKSLDFMDAFGIGMEKRQNTEKNFVKRLLFAYEKNKLYNYEKQVFSFVDRFCIISEQDRDSIKSARKGEIKIIPNGVDFEAFYPRNEKKKYDIVFMGNMGYPPNIAAVQFLASEIMPLVIKASPAIKLLVAGVGAPKSIKILQSKNIDVIENFEHISDSIAISKIMLAPMQISIGLQNKILQAMAMKTPCIVSPASNNAIKAPNDFAIVEASSPAEYAQVIIDMLNNPMMAARIGQNGYVFVKENFSWPAQNKLLEDLILTGFEQKTS